MRPAAADGRVGVQGGGQVGRLGQRLGMVQCGPAAVGPARGHGGQTRGRHEPGRGHPLDPLLVQPDQLLPGLRGVSSRADREFDGGRLPDDSVEPLGAERGIITRGGSRCDP
jgi:hypothetical protein